MFQSMLLKSWWDYSAGDDSLFGATYHVFNLFEGAAWCGLALLVLRRYAIRRRRPVEIAYAAAFACFGVSDFREAYVLETWLILAKGVNLGLLLWLRNHVLRNYYPRSKVF
jgi:hypothetical protein